MMTPLAVTLDGLESWLAHPMAEQVGWVLVHFVWQGTLLAGLLAGALLLLRAERATLRYALSLITLVALVLCPIATWMVLPAPEAASSTAETAPRALAEASTPLFVMTSPEAESASWTEAAQATLTALLPWGVAAWLVGVVMLAFRLLGGWIVTIRLRMAHSHPVPTPWQRRTDDLAERLGVATPVRVSQSAHIDIPMVIGWLRPVVLVPAGVLTGLPPQQVEALIAHELCHIRRHDVLVGWVQALVETALFYHPAVWWISQQVRTEREHCCDDLVVAVCQDRVTYARALTTLAGRQQTAPAGSIGAADGSLLTRIRRLVHTSTGGEDHGYRPPLLVVSVLLIAGALGVAACASQRPAGEGSEAASPAAAAALPATEATDSVSSGDPRSPSRETVDVFIAETETNDDAQGTLRRRVIVDSSGHVMVWADSGFVASGSLLDSLGGFRSMAPDVWIGRARPFGDMGRRFGAGDTIPKPPRPIRPRLAPLDSLLRTMPDPPDIDAGAFRMLDSLRVLRPPMPPPAVLFMDGDTMDVRRFRHRIDSLRAQWPRELGLDSLDRARIDSLRQRVERQMRAHREQVRAFNEEHREEIDRLRREMREQMRREQPERLREQAEVLRRQAERLEEQAREMETRRPVPDTTRSDTLQSALPLDAAPAGTLRAGSGAAPLHAAMAGHPSAVGTRMIDASAARPTWESAGDVEVTGRRLFTSASTSAGARLAALAIRSRGQAPDPSIAHRAMEHTGARSALR